MHVITTQIETLSSGQFLNVRTQTINVMNCIYLSLGVSPLTWLHYWIKQRIFLLGNSCQLSVDSYLCFSVAPPTAAEYLPSRGKSAIVFRKHWLGMRAWPPTGWVALGRSLYFLKTYFLHLWKLHSTVSGCVFVWIKCLVHAKCLLQGLLGKATIGPEMVLLMDGLGTGAEGLLLPHPGRCCQFPGLSPLPCFAVQSSCPLNVRPA